MTQFTKAMIPDSIVTTEALAVWVAEVHSYLYGDVSVLEAIDLEGTELNSRVAESNKFYLTAQTPPRWRHISRLSVGLKPEHQLGGKLWNYVDVIGDKTVPTEMRV